MNERHLAGTEALWDRVEALEKLVCCPSECANVALLARIMELEQEVGA